MEFVFPGALWLGATTALVFWLHLLRGRHQRIDVPSLLLWSAIPDDISRSRRFRPDLLLLLQLGVVACAVLGLAGLRLSTVTTSTEPILRIFVLDVSASMNAKEHGSTRFEQARSLLKTRLATIATVDAIALIVSGAQPRVVVPPTSDRTTVTSYLDSVASTDAPTRLDAAIALAENLSRDSTYRSSIEVFTDERPPQRGDREPARAAFTTVGTSDRNCALTRFEVTGGRFRDTTSSRLLTEVTNFSTAVMQGAIVVETDEKQLLRTNFLLGSQARHTVSTEGPPPRGVVRARIEVDDDLPNDNVAFVFVPDPPPLDVLVVTDSHAFANDLRIVVGQMPGTKLRIARPDEVSPFDLGTIDLAILHRWLPHYSPELPIFAIYPPSNVAFGRVLGESGETAILDWNSHHATLRNLPDGISGSFAHAQALEVSPQEEILLRSRFEEESVAVATAGERNGKRSIRLGIDFADRPLLAADNLQLLVFFLDALEWLAPPKVKAFQLRTGEGLPAAAQTEGRLLSADGSVCDRETSHLLENAGLYRLETPSDAFPVVVNFRDSTESAIGRKGLPRAEEPYVSRSGEPPTRNETLAPILFLLAALTLAGEWWWSQRTP